MNLPQRTLVLVALTAGSALAQVAKEPDEGEHGEHLDHAAPIATAAPPKVVRVHVPEKEGMLLLPGGTFMMGSTDKKARPYERPPHPVHIAPFWIERTEVTVRDYRTCVDAHACSVPQRSSEQCTFEMGDPQLPVSCVTFSQAQAYCRFRAKRLPREAEWEFAARGTQNVRFPWGSNAPLCSYAATVASETTGKTCTDRKPARVGAYPSGASPFGVLDLAGNVEEWTDDVFHYVESFSSVPAPLPPPTVGGENHVLRGGSWMMPPRFARTTSRNWGSATEAGPGVGIRCARDLQQSENTSYFSTPAGGARKPAPSQIPVAAP